MCEKTLLYDCGVHCKKQTVGKGKEQVCMYVYILLGPPGRAQVFPYLSQGPLDLLVVCKNE